MSHIIEDKKAQLEAKRIKHLNELARLFGGWYNPKENEGDKIDYKYCWEYLQKMENKTHRLVEIYCGDGSINQAEKSWNAWKELEELKAIIPNTISRWFNNPEKFKQYLFINLDPRGYSLKLDLPYNTQTTIHKDWGGYGILAPEHLYK